MSLSLRSPAFSPDGEIPRRYTCDGDEVSPPLEWSGVPPSAKSLTLLVDDPDAPDPKGPTRVFVHWVLYDLPPTTTGLPEGVSDKDLPVGAHLGLNDNMRRGFSGPCPPVGRHRYFFKLYALDTVLPDLGPATKAHVEAAMRGHVLEHVELIGTYARQK
jgi:Raf kinase inhibitor-like YbhB/YbcL family protein